VDAIERGMRRELARLRVREAAREVPIHVGADAFPMALVEP
jgi:hypothetical protein